MRPVSIHSGPQAMHSFSIIRQAAYPETNQRPDAVFPDRARTY
jgi:hypothetical protein